MCGIAGSINLTGRRINADRLARATRLLLHRGPDDEGYLSWSHGEAPRLSDDAEAVPPGAVLMGHRRLAILDLSRAGWQPFINASSKLATIYNGEIYNFIELREQLQQTGAHFRSESDTEVLLEMWARGGRSCLNRFIGMFAFCMLDLQAMKVSLVRDFFGIKPLYYCLDNDNFHFASEVLALLELSGISRRVNRARALDYLAYAETDLREETMIEGVKRVLPGEVITLSLNGSKRIESERYWTLPTPRSREISHSDAAKELRTRFLESVSLHLRSDAKVGVALSGGVDSSAILAAIRHLKGDQIDIHSYSYVADEPSISEEKWADIAGRHARATMHKVRPTAEDFAAEVDAHILTNNEPMGFFNGFLGRRVYRNMQQDGLKVSLDGQGADELFAGYDGYYASALVTLLLSDDYPAAWRFNKRLSQLGFSSGLRTFIKQFLAAKAPGLARRVGKSPPLSWIRADIRSTLLTSRARREPNYTSTPDLFSALRTSTYTGLQRLLRCQDLNSMASSIESRVPFLTPQLAETAFTVPADFHIDEAGLRKALLRHALEGIAAKQTLRRQDKQAAPTTNWLKQNPQIVADALDKTQHPARAWFDDAGLEALRAQFSQGRSIAAHQMWRIVNLIRWCELSNLEVAAA